MTMNPLKSDEKLEPFIREHGDIELEPSEDPFERLVVSIVNQQLSTESAKAIKERLFDAVDVTPGAVLEADEDTLRQTGLSRQKVDYLKSAAERFIEDDLSREKFSGMTDEQVIEELTSIHGVGVWTAKMFLIFVLAREDVFPVEDLGIRRAMTRVYGIEDRKDMVDKAEEWRPYRSVASLYLWRSVD